jgi:predicted PurR-regulated permease PerM
LLIFGIPHAGLFTIILLIFSVVQIGSLFVILPLVLWLWIAGETSEALLFAASMPPVLAIEHLLKPVVLAHGIKTPTLIIALGVLGGLLAFGLQGLFIGPVALALFYGLVVFWVWPDRIADEI